MTLSLQCPHDGARSLRRRLASRRSSMSALVGALRAASSTLAGLPFARRRQIDTGFSSFRQADGDRLLRIPRSMFAFADVMHLLADELARLRGRRLALAPIVLRTLDSFLFWHGFAPRIGDFSQARAQAPLADSQSAH